MQQYPTQAEIMAYIVQAAKARNIDPQIALRVASGEGLSARPAEGWQSFVKASKGPNGREDSWGVYQLLKSHEGKPMGVGHEMLTNTGIDPADPTNWQPSIDYALDYAAKNGWSAWYGAKAKGVGPWEGVKNAKAIGVTTRSPQGAALGSYAEGPAAVAARQAKLEPTSPAPDMPIPEEPDFTKPAATASQTKSPQDIYGEYLRALSEIASRPRQPYSLNLATYDTVNYE